MSEIARAGDTGHGRACLSRTPQAGDRRRRPRRTAPDPRPVARLPRFFGVVVRPRTWLNLLYLALAFPLGLFYFVFLVVFLSVGISLVIIWVGIFILALTAACWWAFAAFERSLADGLLGTQLVPSPQPWRRAEGTWPRIKAHFSSSATWKDLAFLFVKFPLGLLSFVVVVTLAATSLALLGGALLLPLRRVDRRPWRRPPRPLLRRLDGRPPLAGPAARAARPAACGDLVPRVQRPRGHVAGPGPRPAHARHHARPAAARRGGGACGPAADFSRAAAPQQGPPAQPARAGRPTPATQATRPRPAGLRPRAASPPTGPPPAGPPPYAWPTTRRRLPAAVAAAVRAAVRAAAQPARRSRNPGQPHRRRAAGLERRGPDRRGRAATGAARRGHRARPVRAAAPTSAGRRPASQAVPPDSAPARPPHRRARRSRRDRRCQTKPHVRDRGGRSRRDCGSGPDATPDAGGLPRPPLPRRPADERPPSQEERP